MKKVWINPGCITCGRCEFIAPEIFEVLDVAYLKKDVDFAAYEQAIQEAAKACPVQVIKYIQSEKKPENQN